MLDPFLEEMRDMQSRMDDMFSRFWRSDPLLDSRRMLSPVSRFLSSQSRMMQPLSNMWETPKEVGLDIDLPGVDKKDIELNIHPDRLEVRAEKKHESKEEKESMYRMERSYAGFFRTFSLPHGIDSAHADAKYENGVLRIRLPKHPDKGTGIKKLDVK